MSASAPSGEEWGAILTVFLVASLFKLLVLAPGLYHSTDFEVHRNWLAVTHSTPLKEWYWEETSEWTLDYPPMFGYFEWALSQAARFVEPDMLKITQHYDPSEAAVWFQRISVMVVDATLVLGVVAWCKGAQRRRGDSGGGGGGSSSGAAQAGFAAQASGATSETINATTVYVGSLVLLNPGLFLVDHIHFQYNGFMLGLLLLSMGLIRQGRVLSGGATFACLLMLKHLFLTLAPLYFVYLLRSYCYRTSADASSGSSSSATAGEVTRRLLPSDDVQGRGGSGDGDRSGGRSGPSKKSRTRNKNAQRAETRGAGGAVNIATPQPFSAAAVTSSVPGCGEEDGVQQPREGAPRHDSPRRGQGEDVASRGGERAAAAAAVTMRLSWKRLASLGSTVLCVFGSATGPLCVSDGWTAGACLRQFEQLGVRLFPFGRGLVHAYWAPNLWAVYLFLDRVFLSGLKFRGLAAASDGKGSTTAGLVRTEVMAVLPSVPAGVCLLLSVLACVPALVVAWTNRSPQAFAWGAVHCSLSSFLLGFHVHEKALLVPAVISAVLALDSAAGARMHLRLSFLAAYAAFPLLPGPELRVVKVVLLITHLTLATSLLEHLHTRISTSEATPGRSIRSPSSSTSSPSSQPRQRQLRRRGRQRESSPPPAAGPSREARGCGGGVVAAEQEVDGGRDSAGPGVELPWEEFTREDTPNLWTVWDKVYVAGAVVVWALGEVVHPWMFGEGTLPFLPLMGVSVFGAVGVVACWGLSVAGSSSLLRSAVQED